MSTNGRTSKQSGKGHRPRATTVFAAAFIAGAAAAFGVNRALDVHLAQSKPRVESEPIFVALRSLPQGASVTVWDVALRDWPKAMMPAAALRPKDSFDGAILKHPIREGQPLLAFQLVKAQAADDTQMVAAPAAALPTPQPVDAIPQPDLWAPGEQASTPAAAAVVTPVEPAPAAVASTTITDAPIANTITATEQSPAEIATTPTAGEPTVAVEQLVGPAEPAAEPEIVSVVQPATESDIEAPPAVAPQTKPQAVATTPAVRYLVVPERIAMQADRSFVSPASTQAPPMQPVQQPQTVERPKPQPSPQQTAKQPPPVREAPQAIQQRARTARQPRTTTNQQPSPQRPAPPKPRGNTSAFQSMFPNISAGMTAVEEQLQKIKREREAASDTPDEQPQPPQRSARSF
jgi:hypothetical protein